MNDWVRFNMTTTALKKIDSYGGVDNYLLALDERMLVEAPYVTKMRNIIATTLYHQGKLNPYFIKKLGYHKVPPLPLVAAVSPASSNEEDASEVIPEKEEAQK